MSFETIVGLVLLGLALICLLVRFIGTRVNWAMIYYKLCGGK